jgi:osmotically-inducible protein OsmY
MQRHPYPWQVALVAGLCVLANPVFAEKPKEERQSLEQTGGTAPAQAATAADQALAERVRQGLQENAPLSGVAQNIHIIVSNGEVTLLGEVKTAEERDGIESQVRQIQGVQVVQNRLHLAGADKESAARAPAQRD